VTHDQVEAMTLGDRVVVMKDGVVQQVGEPLELYNAPVNRFVAGFIGSPAMNFTAVDVAESGGKLWATNQNIRIEIPPAIAGRLRNRNGEPMTLGIRPEDLRLAAESDPAGVGFDAVVEVVEQLGPEILLDVRVGESAMVASLAPNVRARVRDTLRLVPNPDRLHFFDSRSEVAV
jgi:multiple sugar transport system ATP-binding protein